MLSEPLLTLELSRDEFVPESGSTYVYAPHLEPRSTPEASWFAAAAAAGCDLVEVHDQTRNAVTFADGGGRSEVPLRAPERLSDVVSRWSGPVYLDFTGMTYSTWAPIVRAAVTLAVDLRVVYVEPAAYRRSAHPSRGMIFDLSDRIEGIAPLPGFARLGSITEGPVRVVPLLGFEGPRLGYVLAELQESPSSVTPLVGVPGFQPEHPFSTYLGNRTFLEADFLFRGVRYAKANCPFDAFHEIWRVYTDFERPYLKLAPIGTKPHGLAAALFSLSDPVGVELVYDHPVRSAGRTVGEARVCIYDVGSFVTSDLYLRRGEFAASGGS